MSNDTVKLKIDDNQNLSDTALGRVKAALGRWDGISIAVMGLGIILAIFLSLILGVCMVLIGVVMYLMRLEFLTWFARVALDQGKTI